ncbi:MAG TPA: ATP-binding protein [Mycobacteriales bacterium]|nr:ATP-binding protein [Mycobacteriales bacterium]
MTDLAERTEQPAAVDRLRLKPVRGPQQGWSLRRSLTVLAAVATVVALVMVGAGAVALATLSDARHRVVDVIDPAFREAEQLQLALVDQETGIRGYALAKDDAYLRPWTDGGNNEIAAVRALAAVADDPDLAFRSDLNAVEAASAAWKQQYANPIITAVRTGASTDNLTPQLGKRLFDAIRGSVFALQRDLDRASADAKSDLDDAASRLQIVGVLLAIGLVALLLVLAVGLRRVVEGPLSALAGDVRRVADGDFDAEVRGTGPREMVELGADVDAMRQQIVSELAAVREATDKLNRQTQDLERSNTELEQFAYVASHDLQEPLRKVASFTQLLERRYKGQLDERADQYIAFAVDGAKRMQVLINDLLSFSRVGRLAREHVEVGADELVAQALANLSVAIEESGATVTAPPDLARARVLVDQSLVVGVFQNLIGNAIKFRGDAPPEVAIGLGDDGELWEFSIADNGIGIEAEYAERIFVIFQRLHPKDAYPGTGIGLAMCRKIVEYSGGRIWLDTSVPAGTTFHFTLPKLTPTPAEQT